jgi:hypothetical protein
MGDKSLNPIPHATSPSRTCAITATSELSAFNRGSSSNNFWLRLLLERVTDYCYRRAIRDRAKNRFLKIVYSERQAHSYPQMNAYQELLKTQAKGAALALSKRRIMWEVLDWRLDAIRIISLCASSLSLSNDGHAKQGGDH